MANNITVNKTDNKNLDLTLSITNLNDDSLPFGTYNYSSNSTGAPSTAGGKLIHGLSLISSYYYQMAFPNGSSSQLVYVRAHQKNSNWGLWQLLQDANEKTSLTGTINSTYVSGVQYEKYYQHGNIVWINCLLSLKSQVSTNETLISGFPKPLGGGTPFTANNITDSTVIRLNIDENGNLTNGFQTIPATGRLVINTIYLAQ